MRQNMCLNRQSLSPCVNASIFVDLLQRVQDQVTNALLSPAYRGFPEMTLLQSTVVLYRSVREQGWVGQSYGKDVASG